MRAIIGRSLHLYRIYALLSRTDRFVTQNTDICIDGFPRSANSFAVRLLKRACPNITIAHHRHNRAQLEFALRLGVPTIVLIRNPLDVLVSEAIRSYSLGRPMSSTMYAIREYVTLYRFVLAHERCLSIVSFDVITSEPSRFLRLAKKRTGLDIKLEIAEQYVEETLREMKRTVSNDSTLRASVPTVEKRAYKERIRKVLEGPLFSQLEEARIIYRKIAGFKSRNHLV